MRPLENNPINIADAVNMKLQIRHPTITLSAFPSFSLRGFLRNNTRGIPGRKISKKAKLLSKYNSSMSLEKPEKFINTKKAHALYRLSKKKR